MLVNADILLQAIQSYRLVWLSGRFSGGKTSGAYRIAQEFLEQGYRLITNNMCVWADKFEKVQLLDESNHLKSVVILDEGGQYFKSSKQIEMIASYAAKMDCIYLIPSFFPPTRTAQVIIIQPVFNLKAAGLPVIVYRWRVKVGSFEDKGNFFWINPQEIYGVYSRQDPGDNASQIIEFLLQRTQEFRSRYGRGEDRIPELEGIDQEAEAFAEAVAGLESAAEQIASVRIRKTGRRRY